MQPYAHSGRLLSDTRIRAATVYWGSRTGLLRERIVVLNADGSFWYDHEPATGDYLVVASQSHPLVAYRPESFANITIPIPTVVSTQFSIVLRDSYPRDRATPTLVLNGMLIPAEAFSHHAQWRGLSDVVKGKPYIVPGVLVTGPVVVLLAPPFGERPPDLRSEDDIFVLPQYRGVIDRQVVGPDGIATFD